MFQLDKRKIALMIGFGIILMLISSGEGSFLKQSEEF